MHRYQALMELGNEYGPLKLQQLLKGDVPCHVLAPDTPDYLLACGAAKSNDANAVYVPMSWVDEILNLFKFVATFVAQDTQLGLVSTSII